jgi:hypothetical protein
MKSSTRRGGEVGVREVGQAPAPAPGRAHRARPLVALLISGHREESDRYAVKLRLDGYSVVPATGLEQGLERARSAHPDLIFVCLGAWAVPALVLLVLRSDRATRGVPTILVSDLPRARIAAEVGGLRATENVAPRSAAVHAARMERALAGPANGCGRRPAWDQWRVIR